MESEDVDRFDWRELRRMMLEAMEEVDRSVFKGSEAAKQSFARQMRQDDKADDPRLEVLRDAAAQLREYMAEQLDFLIESTHGTESEVNERIKEYLKDSEHSGYVAAMRVMGVGGARYKYVLSLNDDEAQTLFEEALFFASFSGAPGLIYGRDILKDKIAFMFARCFAMSWRDLGNRVIRLGKNGGKASVAQGLKFMEEALSISEVLSSEEGLKLANDPVARACVLRGYHYTCADIAMFDSVMLFNGLSEPQQVVDRVKDMWNRIRENGDKFSKDSIRQAVSTIRKMSPKYADMFQGIDAAESTNLHRPLPKNLKMMSRAKFHEDLASRDDDDDGILVNACADGFAEMLVAFERLTVRENMGSAEAREYEELAKRIPVVEQGMIDVFVRVKEKPIGGMSRVQQLVEVYSNLNEELDPHKKTFQWYLLHMLARIFLRVGNAEEARVRVTVAEQVILRANRKPGPEFFWFRARVNALCGDFAELTALREERQREQAKAQEKQCGTKAKGAKTAAAIRAQEAEAKKAALAKAEAERAEAERRRREMKVAPEVGELHVGRKEDDDDGKRKVRASDKHAQEKDAAPQKGKEEEQEEEEDEAEEPVVVGPSPTYYLSNTRYKTFCRLASGNWKITRAEICDMMEGLGCRVNIDQGKGSHAVISLPGASAEVLIEGENGELLMVLTEFDMDEQGSDGKKKTASAATGANDKGKKGKGKKKQGGTGEGMMITAPNWDSKWDGHVPIYLRKSIAAALKKMGAVEGKVKKGSPLQQDAQID